MKFTESCLRALEALEYAIDIPIINKATKHLNAAAKANFFPVRSEMILKDFARTGNRLHLIFGRQIGEYPIITLGFNYLADPRGFKIDPEDTSEARTRRIIKITEPIHRRLDERGTQLKPINDFVLAEPYKCWTIDRSDVRICFRHGRFWNSSPYFDVLWEVGILSWEK